VRNAVELVIDLDTGQIAALGRDGRRYSPDEIAAAESGARRGDADALAILDAIAVDPAEARARLADAARWRVRKRGRR